jgi:hypothetical protein
MDLVYVLAGLAVPAATCLGLWGWWLAGGRSRKADDAGLAQSVEAVQQRLTELSDQLESMSRHWEERDSRLTGQLNSLIELTEQLGRVDPWIGEKRR